MECYLHVSSFGVGIVIPFSKKVHLPREHVHLKSLAVKVQIAILRASMGNGMGARSILFQSLMTNE